MSSLLPPMTFGRTENSIGKVGKLAPIHIRSPSVSPEGNRGPAPLLPLDDADEVETEDDDAHTPDPENEGRGPSTLLPVF
jgi:hypothetical protein